MEQRCPIGLEPSAPLPHTVSDISNPWLTSKETFMASSVASTASPALPRARGRCSRAATSSTSASSRPSTSSSSSCSCCAVASIRRCGCSCRRSTGCSRASRSCSCARRCKSRRRRHHGAHRGAHLLRDGHVHAAHPAMMAASCVVAEVIRAVARYRSFLGNAVAYAVFGLGMCGSPCAVGVPRLVRLPDRRAGYGRRLPGVA